MKNMSFFMTTQQFIDGTKDVTRRFGWWNLKVGERVRAVKKAMGLKKGERMEALGIIEIVSTRREPLQHITRDDCRREGFPDFEPQQFIEFLSQHYGVHPASVINRIEFKKVSA